MYVPGDKMSDGETDYFLIAVIIAAFFICIFIVFGIFKTREHFELQEHRASCENNPYLRYAQNCSNYDECVTLCAIKLRNQYLNST